MTDVLCSLLDVKSGLYSAPVAYPSTAEACRSFVALLGLGDSTPAQWPNDFILYHVGDFDRSSAVVSSRVPVVLLTGTAAVAQLSALRRERGGAVGGTGVPPEDSGASAERNTMPTAQTAPASVATPELVL